MLPGGDTWPPSALTARILLVSAVLSLPVGGRRRETPSGHRFVCADGGISLERLRAEQAGVDCSAGLGGLEFCISEEVLSCREAHCPSLSRKGLEGQARGPLKMVCLGF